MDEVERKLCDRFCELERGDTETVEMQNICEYKFRVSWNGGIFPTINVFDIKPTSTITYLFGVITEQQILEYLDLTNQSGPLIAAFQAKIDAFVADADKWGLQHHNDKNAFYTRNVW